MKRYTDLSERGLIKLVSLRKILHFNGNPIRRALIEIDHINYGLNKRTKKLNVKARTHFSLNDIERFLNLLDGEYLTTANHRGRNSRYELRMDCPVRGHFFNKEFILIFETDYDKANEIHIITLFPG